MMDRIRLLLFVAFLACTTAHAQAYPQTSETRQVD